MKLFDQFFKNRFLLFSAGLAAIYMLQGIAVYPDGVKNKCEFEEYTSAGGLQTKTASKNYCEGNSGTSAEAKCEADIAEWCVMGKDKNTGRLKGCFYKPGTCRCRPVSFDAECPSDISKTFENFKRTAYKAKLSLFTSEEKIRSDAAWRSAYGEDDSSERGDSEIRKLNRRKAEMKNTASLYEEAQNKGLEAKKQAYKDAVAARERAAEERRRRRQRERSYSSDSDSSYSSSGSNCWCKIISPSCVSRHGSDECYLNKPLGTSYMGQSINSQSDCLSLDPLRGHSGDEYGEWVCK